MEPATTCGAADAVLNHLSAERADAHIGASQAAATHQGGGWLPATTAGSAQSTSCSEAEKNLS